MQCSPAIGNVGQLAMDLLIENTCSTPVAVIESANVLPVVGNDAYSSTSSTDSRGETGTLSTSLELFGVPSSASASPACFLLQQRGPVVTGRQQAFSEEFMEWAKLQQFKRIVVISSLDASMRRESQIDGLQVCRIFILYVAYLIVSN